MRWPVNIIAKGIAVLFFMSLMGCGPGVPEFQDAALLDQLINASSPAAAGDGIAPTVTETVPADGTSAIATNISLSINFSEAMDTTSITADVGSTICAASIQLSADDFATCVSMAGTPSAGSGNTSFMIQPAANLNATTNYKLRVTTAATDASGQSLGANFTMGTGFTTGAGADSTPPMVSSVNPANTNTNIVFTSAVAVTFNEAMNTGTVTTNTAGTTCSGSLQVSSDGFTTCVQMSAVPVPSSGNTIFTLTPNANLNPGTTYQIRVTTAVTDAAGNALAAQFTTAAGFTTRYVLFETAGTTLGHMNGVTGIAGADAICAADTNKPATGTYRAMIVDGATRVACTTANCSGGAGENTNWVFRASTSYYRLDGTTLILTTNAGGVHDFTSMLTNSFGTGGTTYWTGLTIDWRTDTRHCTNWTSSTSGGGVANQGERGSDIGTTGASISAGGGSPNCNTPRTLICVLQ